MLKILTDDSMTTSRTVSRSWKERLFSLTPFKKNKVITEPSRECIMWGNQIVCHPAMAIEIERISK